MVAELTCFNTRQGTLLDVIGTNVSKRFQSTEVFDIGLGDVHSLISFSGVMHFAAKRKNSIVYRVNKHFTEERSRPRKSTIRSL